MTTTLKERVEQLETLLGNAAELARAAGVTKSAVSQWKSAGKPDQLKAAPLLRLRITAGVRPEWVVFGVGPMKESPARPSTLRGALDLLADQLASVRPVTREAVGVLIAELIQKPGQLDELAGQIEALMTSGKRQQPGMP